MTFASVAMKNLVHKPVTKMYPDKAIEYPERSRGHVEITIDDCISCGMCVRSCPTGTLSVDRDAGTWTINRFDCVQCGFCVQKCPKKCLRIVPGYQHPGDAKPEETFTKSPEVLKAEAERRAAQIAAAKAKAAEAAKAKAAEAAKAKAEEKN